MAKRWFNVEVVAYVWVEADDASDAKDAAVCQVEKVLERADIGCHDVSSSFAEERDDDSDEGECPDCGGMLNVDGSCDGCDEDEEEPDDPLDPKEGGP